MTFRISALAAVLLAVCHAASAQQTVVKTNVCDVVAHPKQFDNKMVELRATVVSGFEIFAIRDPQHECGVLWLTYPGNGPTAMTSFGGATPKLGRPPVTLKRDASLAEFEKELNAEMYPKDRGAICIACNRYEVTALLVGRVDCAGRGGFGHLNEYKQQFVLQSVSKVTAKDLAANYDASEFSPEPVHFPSGRISGKVIGPDGQPIHRAEIDAVSTLDVPLYLHHRSTRTDEHGDFDLDVPPGKYVVGINLEHPPSGKFPFAPTYYPKASNREDAQIFEVADHQFFNIVLKLDKTLTSVAVPVHVSWPDGTPVQDGNVWLSEAGSPHKVVGHSVSHTDASGNFMLTGFLGVSYIVHANIYKKPGYVPVCAENQKITTAAENETLSFVFSITGEVCRNRD